MSLFFLSLALHVLHAHSHWTYCEGTWINLDFRSDWSFGGKKETRRWRIDSMKSFHGYGWGGGAGLPQADLSEPSSGPSSTGTIAMAPTTPLMLPTPSWPPPPPLRSCATSLGTPTPAAVQALIWTLISCYLQPWRGRWWKRTTMARIKKKMSRVEERQNKLKCLWTKISMTRLP